MYFIVNKENFVIAASEKFLQNIGARDICLISSMYKDGSINIDDDSKSVKVLSQNLDYTFASSKLYSAFGELTHYRLYNQDEKVTQSDSKTNDISHLKQVKESATTIVDDEYKAPTISQEDDINSQLQGLMDSIEDQDYAKSEDSNIQDNESVKEVEDIAIESKEAVTDTIKELKPLNTKEESIKEIKPLGVKNDSENTSKEQELIKIEDDNKLADVSTSGDLEEELVELKRDYKDRSNESVADKEISVPPVPLDRLKKKDKLSKDETDDFINELQSTLSESKNEKFVTITEEEKKIEDSDDTKKEKKKKSLFPWKKRKKDKEISDDDSKETSIESPVSTKVDSQEVKDATKINIQTPEAKNNKVTGAESEILNALKESTQESVQDIKSVEIEDNEIDNKTSDSDKIIKEFQGNSTDNTVQELKAIDNIDENIEDILNKKDNISEEIVTKEVTPKVESKPTAIETIGINNNVNDPKDNIEARSLDEKLDTLKEVKLEDSIPSRDSKGDKTTESLKQEIETINLENNAKKLNLDIDSYKMLLTSYIDETQRVQEPLTIGDSKTIDMLTDAAQLLALDSFVLKLTKLKNSEPFEKAQNAKEIEGYISNLKNKLNDDEKEKASTKTDESIDKNIQELKDLASSETLSEKVVRVEAPAKNSITKSNSDLETLTKDLENIQTTEDIQLNNDIDIFKSAQAESIVLDIETTSQELNLPSELILEFIKDFLDQAKEHLPTLSEAQQRKDIDKIQTTAHMLKGAANNLRLSSIGDTLFRIQKSSDFDSSKELIGKFASLTKGLEIALKDVENK